MPVKRCMKNGRPGFKWGDQGKCYTYNPANDASRERAKSKASKQGRAARAAGYKG